MCALTPHPPFVLPLSSPPRPERWLPFNHPPYRCGCPWSVAPRLPVGAARRDRRGPTGKSSETSTKKMCPAHASATALHKANWSRPTTLATRSPWRTEQPTRCGPIWPSGSRSAAAFHTVPEHASGSFVVVVVVIVVVVVVVGCCCCCCCCCRGRGDCYSRTNLSVARSEAGSKSFPPDPDAFPPPATPHAAPPNTHTQTTITTTACPRTQAHKLLKASNKRAGQKGPFYPPPNKTHGELTDTNRGSSTAKHARKASKHSLRQAARVREREAEAASARKGFGNDNDKWGVTDMVPIELDSHITDLHAKVDFYEKQIPDLQQTVDTLRSAPPRQGFGGRQAGPQQRTGGTAPAARCVCPCEPRRAASRYSGARRENTAPYLHAPPCLGACLARAWCGRVHAQ